jgi:hypothetical protein
VNRAEVPAGKHLAVPTKYSDTVHEGPYAEHCVRCQATVAEIATRQRPVVDGSVVNFGSAIKLKPEHHYVRDPEWVTVTDIRVNSHTGQVWLSAYALGFNRILVADDIAEVRA